MAERDIKDRLRAVASMVSNDSASNLLTEAADRIAELESANAFMRSSRKNYLRELMLMRRGDDLEDKQKNG